MHFFQELFYTIFRERTNASIKPMRSIKKFTEFVKFYFEIFSSSPPLKQFIKNKPCITSRHTKLCQQSQKYFMTLVSQYQTTSQKCHSLNSLINPITAIKTIETTKLAFHVHRTQLINTLQIWQFLLNFSITNDTLVVLRTPYLNTQGEILGSNKTFTIKFFESPDLAISLNFFDH